MPGPDLSFGPRRGQVVLLAVLGAALLAAGLASDGGGALLALPAGAVALALAARDALRPVVLQADTAGLTVVRGLRRERTGWQAVEGLRVVRDRRTALLELDLAGGLHVLSRARLGRDPQEVLVALEPLRSGLQR